MNTTLDYNATAYQNLSKDGSMHESARQHLDELLSLGEVICRHGLEKILGVYLMHRHHDLATCERFVWELDGKQWNGRPRICDDAELISTNWKIGDSIESDLHPLEFCYATEEYRPEIDAATQVLTNSAFLNEFKKKAVELGVQNIFGLALHQSREEFVKPDKMMFEQSYTSSRTTSAWLVPSEKAEESEGITLWHFIPQSDMAPVRACSHGNSRCCCGG